MNIAVNSANFTVFIVALISLILVIIIFKKIVKFVLILILLAALIYYVFGYSNMIRPKSKHAKYSINYVKEKSYENMETHRDSVKYFYIIEPIYNDLTSRYTDEQLLEYERHPKQYYQIVSESVKRNKKQILNNLVKQKEKRLFYEFWNTWHLQLKKTSN